MGRDRSQSLEPLRWHRKGEEAREFVDCGIDWLAPAFGNLHGNYGSRGIQLKYDRLQAINDEVGKEVRLVLHGTDSFTEEIFNKCIRLERDRTGGLRNNVAVLIF